MLRVRTTAALALLLALLCVGGSVSAQTRGPTVTAVLDTSETSLGNPVQLQIKVTGAANPKPPAGIAIDGLDIRYAGTSREYQMQNFSVSYSFTFSYTIMPLEAGTYTIPPQAVEAAGQQLYTPELTLNVVASSGRTQRGRRGRGSAPDVDVEPGQVGFVEMLVPKTTAYVGEMIPVQVRLGLNMRTPVESLGSGIQVAGQGFTTQKMPEPRQTIETINGSTYQVFVFKTAISPVRAGTLEIGPAEINPTVRVPQRIEPRSLMPRGFDDPFFNNFFDDPFLRGSIPREVKLRSESATVEVKPLPPNAPATFGGAIGTFTLRADANPKKVQVGDPVTVTATVTGRGSFDRVTAPALEDSSGWHTYPPSDDFKQDDDVGISGAKTFEMVVSPKEPKNALPPLIFSFFDPVKETYVTLRSEPLPVVVQGGAAPTATPAVVSAGSPPPAAAPPAAPTPPQEQEILYQLTEQSPRVRTFTPLYARPLFWGAQLVPLVALLGFVGWRVRQARLDDREAQRVARLQQEAAELQRTLHQSDADARQYLAAASRTVQLKTALARNVDPNTVDAESAASAFRLDEHNRDRLRELFARNDELRYSGNGHNGRAISAEQRQEITNLVETLRV